MLFDIMHDIKKAYNPQEAKKLNANATCKLEYLCSSKKPIAGRLIVEINPKTRRKSFSVVEAIPYSLLKKALQSAW